MTAPEWELPEVEDEEHPRLGYPHTAAEAEDPGGDDVERAGRRADESREREQDDADNEVAPDPGDDQDS